jgi:hypothetical protein
MLVSGRWYGQEQVRDSFGACNNSVTRNGESKRCRLVLVTSMLVFPNATKGTAREGEQADQKGDDDDDEDDDNGCGEEGREEKRRRRRKGGGGGRGGRGARGSRYRERRKKKGRQLQ